MEEPSVLDYLKAKLTPWRGKKIEIPPAEATPTSQTPVLEGLPPAPGVVSTPEVLVPVASPVGMPEPATEAVVLPAARTALPWRSLLGVGLALIGQLSLEPGPQRTWQTGVLLYLLGAGMLAWGYLRSEWVAVGHLSPTEGRQPAIALDQPSSLVLRRSSFIIRPWSFVISLVLATSAYLTLGGNHFTGFNVTLWLLSILALVHGFWQPDQGLKTGLKKLATWIVHSDWRLTVDPWWILVVAAIVLCVFFRVNRIEQVPPEMVSDHAEKILDVWDVMHGGTSIFFPRNTGREAIQMYLTAAIISLLGTGYSYLSLKIGTILAGLLTLPYIYLLGKEFGSRRVGLYAMLFAGIAYWPNVISRVGLRFPLYPLFVAPALYYLMRGLRTARINDFLLAGLALGFGLHGYTPIRILPFVIVVAVGLFWLHRQPQGSKAQALRGLVLIVMVSFYVFLPLLRYAVENPEMFSFRSLSRLSSVEQPLPGPAGTIFLSNLLHAMTMFAWDDGEIWVHSVMHRPALDVVSAALFYLGMVLLLVRYLRQRDWRDLFWLLAVPLLMMPSILSLAFPAENPALNRMGGAIVPVFLIVGLGMDGLLQTLRTQINGQLGQGLAWGLGLFLVFWASLQNYDLVFHQYYNEYLNGAWNTSEMGQVIREYAGSVGSGDTAWVLAFPYWVDTRLVGINAGYTTRDYAISPDQLPETLAEPRSKLFLVKPEDTNGLQALQNLYPLGVVQEYHSQVEGHDFWIYFVPPVK
jgi:hypothetical protein